MSYGKILKQLQDDIIEKRYPLVHFKAHHTLSSMQQLAIYADGYQTRLQKVVANIYPATESLMGQEGFKKYLRQYVRKTVSTSYNIDHYTLGFADYIANKATKAQAELARLERAVAENFLLPDSPALTPEYAQTLSEEVFAALPLYLRDASELLQTEFAVNDALTAFREGQPLAEVPLKPQYILLYRHQRQIHRMTMEPLAYHLLSLLAEGRNLMDAIDRMSERYAEEEITPEWLGAQFQQWLGAGVFKVSAVSDISNVSNVSAG